MVNAAILRSVEAIDRRAEDARAIYLPGSEPNYTDTLRTERIEPANDPLAIAVPEATFLITGDPLRPGYTRSGALRIESGALVTNDGRPVLGFPSDAAPGDVPRPLRADRRDALLGRIFDARIDPDGLFGYARTVIDAQTLESRTERVDVGRVALARFPSGTKPERTGAIEVRPPAGVTPFVGTPADGAFGALAARSRATGRIDPDAAIARLQDEYVALRALGAAERARNGMLRGAFDLLK